jgi:hypothetical protein
MKRVFMVTCVLCIIGFAVAIIPGQAVANPVAVVYSPDGNAVGLYPVTFTGATSYDNTPGATIISYQWDFDFNGTFTEDATGVTVTHEYLTWGVHTTGLRVTSSLPFNPTSIATYDTAVSFVIVPLPPTVLLLGSGLLGLVGWRRFRKG